MTTEAAAMATAPSDGGAAVKTRLQRRRRAFQLGFFALFLLAPSLDLLRFDLTETQLWFLGMRWSLGIDAFVRGEASATETALAIVLRGIVPAVAFVAAFMTVAWRYGRLYCGWLCPHFSLVEGLNDLLHRASGRFSVWERPTPHGTRVPDRRWWPVFVVSCAFFGFLWAITLLTYLLPPATVWGNLVHGTLTPNQARFIGIAGTVFTLEMLFARHLFCRFGCAVGLFQSLAWMANPRGMVVAFDRSRARECRTCATPAAPRGAACDQVCPMRLNPRQIKRLMFSCVQCGQCLGECGTSRANVALPLCSTPAGGGLGEAQPWGHPRSAQGREPLLEWKIGLDAVKETLRQRRDEAAGR